MNGSVNLRVASLSDKLEIGALIEGRFRIDAVLGQGGTATVYQAHDTELGVDVALKVLRADPQCDVQFRARLRSEAKVMIRLSHPNILRVHAVGEDGDWLAVELSLGGSVGEFVRDHGPLPARRALQISLQTLQALEVAHQEGVIHRDIKPENLLLQADGTIKLCDFGIALVEGDTRVTRAGFAMGSLAYMAPEQRVDARNVGTQADLYAVGATLYFLLTAGTPVDLFLAPPNSPRFSGIPEGIVEILRKATAANPQERYSDAREMADILRGCLRHASDQVVVEAQPVFSTVPVTAAIPTSAREPTEEREERDTHRQWMEASKARRVRAQRRANVLFAVLVVLFTLGLAFAVRTNLQELAREPAEGSIRASVEGVWKGTFGVHQATLTLHGSRDQLSGEMVIDLDGGELRSQVTGTAIGSSVLLFDVGSHIRSGQYRATLADGARLDGEFVFETDVEPFHLVRVAGIE